MKVLTLRMEILHFLDILLLPGNHRHINSRESQAWECSYGPCDFEGSKHTAYIDII